MREPASPSPADRYRMGYSMDFGGEALHHLLTAYPPAMFTILLRTAHGWTDDLGQHEPNANSWSTHDDAVAAIASLQAVGIGCNADAFRIVSTEHLDRYELMA